MAQTMRAVVGCVAVDFPFVLRPFDPDSYDRGPSARQWTTRFGDDMNERND